MMSLFLNKDELLSKLSLGSNWESYVNPHFMDGNNSSELQTGYFLINDAKKKSLMITKSNLNKPLIATLKVTQGVKETYSRKADSRDTLATPGI